MSNTKYPFMVEFSGSPEAGKTTCIKNLINRFTLRGLKVRYIVESAEIVDKNIPYASFEAHLSMRFITLNQIIGAKYSSEYDIILIDRGLIDGIVFTLQFLSHRVDSCYQYTELINFLDSLKCCLSPDFLLIFKASPDVSIKRKGREGRIVNNNFLEEYNTLLDDFKKSLTIPYEVIDTSSYSKEIVADIAFNLIMSEMSKSR